MIKKRSEDTVITYHAKVSDIDGRHRDFTFAEPVSFTELERLRTQVEYSIDYLNARCHRHLPTIMEAEPWVCSAREGVCRERAALLVFTPMNYMHIDPPAIYDIGPIPVCRDPKCNIAAHSAHRDIAKEVSRQCEKSGISKKG
jgi:hypothetical protein